MFISDEDIREILLEKGLICTDIKRYVTSTGKATPMNMFKIVYTEYPNRKKTSFVSVDLLLLHDIGKLKTNEYGVRLLKLEKLNEK